MTIKELISILCTLDPSSRIVVLDKHGNSVTPRVHITNYLNTELQEVIIDYE
jgi:hypothetical protein